MQELIDVERIVVDHPRTLNVSFDRAGSDAVRGWVEKAISVAVQQEIEGDDINRGNEVIGPNRRVVTLGGLVGVLAEAHLWNGK